MKQHKNLLFIISILIIAVTAFAATIPSKIEPLKYKNLKVLPKNISETALDKVMDNFNFSLGVTCDYCHSKTDKPDELKFESDTKPEKEIARKMMLMMYDINLKYFNGTKDRLAAQTVNCYTCHRQSPYPILDSVKVGGK